MNAPTPKSILVAMSGGIDSSVTAALLKSQGYDVHGVHFTTCKKTDTKSTCPTSGGSCASVKSAEDAEAVAKQLGISLHLVDLTDDYHNEVMDYLVHETLRLKKANPCFMCNAQVKIKALLSKATALKIDLVSTGHYVKVVRSSDGNETNVYRGLDKTYDQSHLFFDLKQDQLLRMITPMGELLRANVEKMAFTFRLKCAKRPLTRETCFIDSGQYKEIVQANSSERYRLWGTVAMQDGHVLGRHQGLYRYQIGEKPDFKLDKPEYREFIVLGFDIRMNALIMGPPSEGTKAGVMGINSNWIGSHDFSRGFSAIARIGMNDTDLPCTVTLLADKQIWIEFSQPQESIPLGQPIVFYRDEILIGGAWLEALSEPISSRLRPK